MHASSLLFLLSCIATLTTTLPSTLPLASISTANGKLNVEKRNVLAPANEGVTAKDRLHFSSFTPPSASATFITGGSSASSEVRSFGPLIDSRSRKPKRQNEVNVIPQVTEGADSFDTVSHEQHEDGEANANPNPNKDKPQKEVPVSVSLAELVDAYNAKVKGETEAKAEKPQGYDTVSKQQHDSDEANANRLLAWANGLGGR